MLPQPAAPAHSAGAEPRRVRGGGDAGVRATGARAGRHAARQGETGARLARGRDAEGKERYHAHRQARARAAVSRATARAGSRGTLCAGCARRRAGVPSEPGAQTSGGGAKGAVLLSCAFSLEDSAWWSAPLTSREGHYHHWEIP